MKKVCNKYYLSVEGETEKWYFEHLQKLIEKNFKEKILSKINLNDVITAVKNGNEIRKINERNSKKNYRKYGQFEYYAVNPDMTINECVEKILIECEAIKKEAQNG